MLYLLLIDSNVELNALLITLSTFHSYLRSFWGGVETEKSRLTVETHNSHKQEMSQWPKQKKHASNETVL